MPHPIRLALPAAALLWAAQAQGQISNAMSCIASAQETPRLRARGFTELVGDILINCTGGTPTAVGATVPQFNFQVFFNTNVTSRLLADPLTEALLIVDDPPPAAQQPCTATVCAVVGVGPPSGVNFGSPSAGVRNVFQGRLNGANNLLWAGIPIDPPGNTTVRRFRITNVRINATPLTGAVNAMISLQGSSPPPVVNNPNLTVGNVLQNASFQVVLPSPTLPAVVNGPNPPSPLNPYANHNAGLEAGLYNYTLPGGRTMNLRYQESFPDSFMHRNRSTTSSTPDLMNPQSAPGTAHHYEAECGFYNPSFPSTNNLNKAGEASNGSQLRACFSNIPPGVSVWVTKYPVVVTADTNSVKAWIPDTDCLTPLPHQDGPFCELVVSGGNAQAVWEVLESDPNVTESVSFGVALSWMAASMSSGAVHVAQSIFPDSTVSVASSTSPEPRFNSPCKEFTTVPLNGGTSVLFPYIVNTVGFDTGIVITNTTLDTGVFDSAGQTGTCRAFFYKYPGPNPPSITSPVLNPGAQWIFTLSDAAPGFQGYALVKCGFAEAYGVAVISDPNGGKSVSTYTGTVLPERPRASPPGAASPSP